MSDNEEAENKFNDHFFQTAKIKMKEMQMALESFKTTLRRTKFEGPKADFNKVSMIIILRHKNQFLIEKKLKKLLL